jgi:Na+-translocating ferredoxin:NAD+ oxidoreductase RNF subunit RnfB
MHKHRFRIPGIGRRKISRITGRMLNNHRMSVPSDIHKQTADLSNQTNDINILKEQAKLIEERLTEISKRINDFKSGKIHSKVIGCIDEEKCDGCKRCIAVCPYDAITIRNNIAVIIQTKCLGCGECVRVCKNRAIRLKKVN